MAFKIDPKGGKANRLWTLAWAEANFCSVFIRLNRRIARARRQKGRWLFPTRLLAHRPISRQSRFHNSRIAAG